MAHLAVESICRPGDGALPRQYIPTGTQVGTPAWIPDPPEGEAQVAKNWFVIIKGSGERKAARKARHVKMDTAGSNLSALAKTTSQASALSGQSSIVSLGSAGICCAVLCCAVLCCAVLCQKLCLTCCNSHSGAQSTIRRHTVSPILQQCFLLHSQGQHLAATCGKVILAECLPLACRDR